MKKIIIASILGLAVSGAVDSVYGQGQVYFQNYTYAGAGLIAAPVTYANSNVPAGKEGQLIGSEFNANLLYSLDGGNTYSSLGLAVPFFGTDGSSASFAGWFADSVNSPEIIPGYSSGAVSFIVQAFNGASYASSTIRGQSAVVVLSSLVLVGSTSPAGTLLSDNTAATSPLQAFTVSAVPVPEPSTLALAGLGGFGMLMALRRKKA